MFFKNVQLAQENEKLRERVAALEKAIDKNNQECVVQARKDVSSATMSIDFKTMKVFSVERGLKDQYTPYTVIGYFIQTPVSNTDGSVVGFKDTVGEWSLFCSHDEHERIVREFNEYRNSK